MIYISKLFHTPVHIELVTMYGALHMSVQARMHSLGPMDPIINSSQMAISFILLLL